MIVVTGADGQLGSELTRLLGDRATGLRRTDLDLADLDAIEPTLARRGPSLVINCAAYNAVDKAEEEPEAARTINALAVERMARATRRLEAGFVTFSSDFAFDGAATEPYVESDAPNPLNAYGASKVEGERLALAAHPGALVVRVAWVMSALPRNFAASILRLTSQRPISVVSDQVGSPTMVADLAPAVMAAVEAGATGLLHLTNQGLVSRFELAREVLELAGRDPQLISPITTEDYGAPAARPLYAKLGSERLAELGLAPLPPYRPALAEAVEALVGAGV